MSKPTKQEQERDMRSALAMLERAKHDAPYSAGSEGNGPVSYPFAIGWAMGCLRQALGLPNEVSR